MLEIIAYKESANERMLVFESDGHTHAIIWDDASNERTMSYIKDLIMVEEYKIREDEANTLADILRQRYGVDYVIGHIYS